MLQYFKKQRLKMEQKDLADRKAFLVRITFKTVLQECQVFTEWVRLGNYSSGINGYKKSLLYPSTLTVGEVVYNTKHIVSLESEIIKEGYVKKSFKKKLGGYKWKDLSSWSFNDCHSQDEIE